MAEERLQKILARAGIASRRASETLIEEGRVRVNGRIVTALGTKANAHKDKIEVNGKRIVTEKPAYYVMHKPREVVTTMSDPEGRKTIASLIERIPERVYPVGRLDYHTSGVILLTNDGKLAETLTRSNLEVPKVYAIKVQGHLTIPELDALRNGVMLDDGYKTKTAELFVIREEAAHTWIQITLTEGKNRQLRRMGEAIGHPVMRLARLSFAGIEATDLRPGQFRPINKRELEKLKRKYMKQAGP